MPDVNLNQLWARAIVEELVRSGVRLALICPGSRSSPLALACAQNPGLRCLSVIDERSAAFMALGWAKQSGSPAVLVATSGTAGAHFYPAVIEAAQSHVPLIVLTADRPIELQGWGAPQTVPQARLYGEFARFFADLGLPEAREPTLLHLRATVSRAVGASLHAPRGAVQLNVPFREPLAPLPEAFAQDGLSAVAREGRVDLPVVRMSPPTRRVAQDGLDRLRLRLSAVERGVIVSGPRDADDGLRQALHQLSQSTGYPILAEACSQLRFGAQSPLTLAHYDALLRHPGFAEAHRPELILRFGGGITAKGPQQWLDQAAAETFLFSDEGALFDPSHRAVEILEGDPVQACQALCQRLSARGPGKWAASFVEAERRAAEGLRAEMAEWTEPRLAQEAVAALPEGATLFVSSSMPIRDLDAFVSRSARPLRVLANRGANGIDGIVSSALGVSVAAGKPTLLLTGDLAFLHDLGGLLTARRHGLSLTVLVVNNDGGGIFSFLPIAQFSEHFEALFGTPHQLDLSHAASLFGAHFHRPSTLPELKTALQTGLEGGLHLIEAKVDRQSNVDAHRTLFARMTQSMGAGPWV